MAEKPLADTRYYLSVFMDTLRDLGHTPANVRTVLEEFLGAPIVGPDTTALRKDLYNRLTSRYLTSEDAKHLVNWLLPLSKEPKQ